VVFNLDALIESTGAEPNRDYFTPANGNPPTPAQTVFLLSTMPLVPARVIGILNGVEYGEGVAAGGYFTVSGSTLTWAGPPTLGPTDEFEVIY